MNNFGSIFGPETDNVLQKTHSKSMPKKRGKVMQTRPMSGANSTKWHQKGSPRSPKAHKNGTKLMPKRPKIHQNDARGQNNIFLKDFGPIWGTTSAPFSVQQPLKCTNKTHSKFDA